MRVPLLPLGRYADLMSFCFFLNSYECPNCRCRHGHAPVDAIAPHVRRPWVAGGPSLHSTPTLQTFQRTVDAWKHRFSSECLSIVHDQVFGARTPSYSTIMELDKRVRNYSVPPSLQVPGFGGSNGYTLASVSMGGGSMNGGQETPSMALTMQRHIILAIKEVSEYMRSGYVHFVFL